MSSPGAVQTGDEGGPSTPVLEGGTGTDADADGGDLSRDAIFEILSNQRRRFALHYLRGCEEPTSLSDLVQAVAAWENDVGPEELDYKQRKRTYTSLYQTHLPKMADSGVIEYGRSRDDIRLTERATALDAYLEATPEGAFAWQKYYLALAAAGATLLTAQVAGAYPLSSVPTVAISGVIVAAFFVSSLAHVYRTERSRADQGPASPETNPDE